MAGKAHSLVKFILARNKKQSAEFCTPGAQLARRMYRAQHPSEIIALKCMDGRLNLSVMTNTPPGIIKPYRNIGGRFDLGWPYFGRLMLDDIEYAVSKGRPTFVLSTYHFSKGSGRRGCAGFGYDTAAARRSAERLRRQFELAFGADHKTVFPLVAGIETDEGGLIFSAEERSSKRKGAQVAQTFDIAANVDASEDDMYAALRGMYPDIPENVLDDLMPLVAGNQRYVKTRRAERHTVADLEHNEQIIAVGRGFDWLHLPNRALMIGPYDPQWESAVASAGHIIVGNMTAKRVPAREGALLLVLAPFRSIGADQGVAIEKAQFLEREALRVLKKQVPALVKKLKVLVGTVDMNTRDFHVVRKS